MIATLLQDSFHPIVKDSWIVNKATMPKPHYYFVEDEHYNYFYDMYCLDYVHQDMMEVIIGSIKSKYFPDAELQRLKEGLEKLKHTEAYEDYGVPYVLGMHTTVP